MAPFMRWILVTLSILILLLLPGCAGSQPAAGTPTANPSPTPTPEIGVMLETRAAPTVAVVQTTPTPLPPPTATPTATPIIYQIEEGDTLLGIALEHYTTVDEIKGLNPSVVPELLQIGQQLQLPPPATPVFQGELSTPIPLEVTISSVQLYRTPIGGMWLLGEVVNEGEFPATNLQVQIDLHGETGTVVQSATAWIVPSALPPGARAPFGVLLAQAPAGQVQPSVAIINGETLNDLGTHYFDLALQDGEVTIDEGRVQLTGTVRNAGDAAARQINVVVTLYDSQDRVTGYAQRVLPGPLAPAASLPFSFSVTVAGGQAVDYGVVVAAHRVE